MAWTELGDASLDSGPIPFDMLGHDPPGHEKETLVSVPCPSSRMYRICRANRLCRFQGVPMKRVVALVENGHRIENRIPNPGIDILRLIGDQKQIGRLAAHIGIGIGRKKARAGLAHFDNVTIAGCHLAFEQSRRAARGGRD